MNKQEFLKKLRRGLRKLKKDERNKYIEYYDEIISDIMDNGVSEADAVEKQGSVGKISRDILAAASPASLRIRDWRAVTLTFASGFMLLICIIPAMIKAQYEVQMSGVIGGADGPTSIFIAGRLGTPWGLYIATALVVCATVIYFIRKRKEK